MLPACHLSLLADAFAKQGTAWPEGAEIHTGGEDWPDAYRYTPMAPSEALGCIVTWWHPGLGERVYQVYFGLLFGLPNAVTSFNRWSKLAEALVRRLLAILFFMYFDDGTMQDWARSAEVSQQCVQDLMALFGSPWAPAKRQAASDEADFLGLLHNTTQAHRGKVVL